MGSKNDINLSSNDKAQIVSLARRGDMTAKALVDGFNDRLIEGGLLRTPTTPSTQAAGVGNTDWNINHDLVVAVVDGVVKEVAAAADLNVHTGSLLMANGLSCKAAMVLKVAANGTASVIAVKGTPATTGTEVAPTNDEIQTGVGAGLSWLKLGETTLNRTGDTTVTQTQDNTKRDVGLNFA